MDAFKSLIIIIKYNINNSKNMYTNLSINLSHFSVGCFHIYPLMIIIMCLMKFSLPLLNTTTSFFMYMLHNYIKIYD